jgi:hypothetical protein
MGFIGEKLGKVNPVALFEVAHTAHGGCSCHNIVLVYQGVGGGWARWCSVWIFTMKK